MSPTSYRCSTSRCLDGKDRRLLLLDQVYAYQIETSAERGYFGVMECFFRSLSSAVSLKSNPHFLTPNLCSTKKTDHT